MTGSAYAQLSNTKAGNSRLELQASGEDMESLVAALPLEESIVCSRSDVGRVRWRARSRAG
jgi:hypothetical protein